MLKVEIYWIKIYIIIPKTAIWSFWILSIINYFNLYSICFILGFCKSTTAYSVCTKYWPKSRNFIVVVPIKNKMPRFAPDYPICLQLFIIYLPLFRFDQRVFSLGILYGKCKSKQRGALSIQYTPFFCSSIQICTYFQINNKHKKCNI